MVKMELLLFFVAIGITIAATKNLNQVDRQYERLSNNDDHTTHAKTQYEIEEDEINPVPLDIAAKSKNKQKEMLKSQEASVNEYRTNNILRNRIDEEKLNSIQRRLCEFTGTCTKNNLFENYDKSYQGGTESEERDNVEYWLQNLEDSIIKDSEIRNQNEHKDGKLKKYDIIWDTSSDYEKIGRDEERRVRYKKRKDRYYGDYDDRRDRERRYRDYERRYRNYDRRDRERYNKYIQYIDLTRTGENDLRCGCSNNDLRCGCSNNDLRSDDLRCGCSRNDLRSDDLRCGCECSRNALRIDDLRCGCSKNDLRCGCSRNDIRSDDLRCGCSRNDLRNDDLRCGCSRNDLRCGCSNNDLRCGCSRNDLRSDDLRCGCSNNDLRCGCSNNDLRCGCSRNDLRSDDLRCGCSKNDLRCGCSRNDIRSDDLRCGCSRNDLRNDDLRCGCSRNDLRCGCSNNDLRCGCSRNDLRSDDLRCGCSNNDLRCGCSNNDLRCGCSNNDLRCGCSNNDLRCGCSRNDLRFNTLFKPDNINNDNQNIDLDAFLNKYNEVVKGKFTDYEITDDTATKTVIIGAKDENSIVNQIFKIRPRDENALGVGTYPPLYTDDSKMNFKQQGNSEEIFDTYAEINKLVSHLRWQKELVNNLSLNYMLNPSVTFKIFEDHNIYLNNDEKNFLNYARNAFAKYQTGNSIEDFRKATVLVWRNYYKRNKNIFKPEINYKTHPLGGVISKVINAAKLEKSKNQNRILLLTGNQKH